MRASVCSVIINTKKTHFRETRSRNDLTELRVQFQCSRCCHSHSGASVQQMEGPPHDLEPLTPNQLLLLKTLPVLPPGIFHPTDLYARRRWKQVQYMTDLFWHRWTEEYLLLLQERQMWTKVKRNISVGDIVLVVDPTAPGGSWPMGRVLESRPDGKGLVQSVKLQTKTSIYDVGS